MIPEALVALHDQVDQALAASQWQQAEAALAERDEWVRQWAPQVSDPSLLQSELRWGEQRAQTLSERLYQERGAHQKGRHARKMYSEMSHLHCASQH